MHGRPVKIQLRVCSTVECCIALLLLELQLLGFLVRLLCLSVVGRKSENL